MLNKKSIQALIIYVLKMKKVDKPGYQNLREKAEEVLKNKSAGTAYTQSEAEMLRLIHELEVHEIELKIQNEELLQAKEQAQRDAEKNTRLFDFAPSGYFILSKEGEIIDVNFSGRKMLGKARHSLKNSMFGFFISDDSKQIFNHFLTKSFESKITESCTVILSIENKIPVHCLLTGLADEKNENCLVNMVDISSIKQAEEKMKNLLNELTIANKEILFHNEEREKSAAELAIINKELEHSIQLNNEKNLFISILGHDLRNQFSGVLGFSELLQENIHLYTTAEIKDFINKIYTSGHKAYNLLEDILMWATTRSNKSNFNPQEMSFKDLCKKTIPILSQIADTKKIAISFNKRTDINFVADIEMLKTILRNLIYNAIKFTNINGSIKIKAKKNPGNVTISVSDDGIGIAPENLTKLFDTSQFNTTTGTAEETGTGLGLLLCKEFVEIHGGRIWVESEFGKGSVFSFTIPGKSKTIIENVVLDSDEVNRNDYLKVLIADDNELIRTVLGKMLTEYSNNILYAKSGDEAVETFRNNPDIDLIFIDFNMPGIDGYEATRIIRQISKKVIIIVETADTYSKVIEEFAGVVINDYFPKPFNKLYLDQLIRKHFNKGKSAWSA